MEQKEKGGGSGDGSDGEHGSMDWKQSVETRLGQLNNGLWAVVAMIIGLYVWTGITTTGIKDKFEPVNKSISSVSQKVAVMETRNQSIENTVVSIDRKIDLLDDKMNSIIFENFSPG